MSVASLGTLNRNRGSVRRVFCAGFTLVEVMVVIGIVAIATAVALPDLTQWVSNNHIQSAASDFQQNLQWARAYALKSDQGVNVDVASQVYRGQSVCSWTISLYATPTVAIAGAPAMAPATAGAPPQFATTFPGVSCALPATALMPVTMLPDGTIATLPLASSVAGGAAAAAPTPANGLVSFASASNIAGHVEWLVKYYGAGELRSCVAAPTGAPVTNPPATTSAPCVLQ